MANKKKEIERMYAENAAELLNENWIIKDIEEPLDFIITNKDNERTFGLEIINIYQETQKNGGSVEKRIESERNKSRRAIAKSYYAQDGKPIHVTFASGKLGDTDKIVSALLSLSPKDFPVGHRETIEILNDDEPDTVAHVTFLPQTEEWSDYSAGWRHVDNHWNWVLQNGNGLIRDAVSKKAKKLPEYKKKCSEIDLLIVAYAKDGSGMINYVEGETIAGQGFNRILFMRYPNEIYVVG